jgi:hypothetical protein
VPRERFTPERFAGSFTEPEPAVFRCRSARAEPLGVVLGLVSCEPLCQHRVLLDGVRVSRPAPHHRLD